MFGSVGELRSLSAMTRIAEIFFSSIATASAISETCEKEHSSQIPILWVCFFQPGNLGTLPGSTIF